MVPMSEPGEPEPTTIECRAIADLLGDYLDGTLSPRIRELIDWHIEGCGPCVAFVNTYRTTIRAAGKLRETDIPPELRQRLLAVLRLTRASEESRP
jgi:hypothetical protein